MDTSLYIPTSALLKNKVHLIWQLEKFHIQPLHETIIPKGVVEVIFNFSDNSDIHAHLYRHQFQIPKCFINGHHTYPVQLHLNGRQEFFGVVFSTLVIKHVFGIPAGEFANCCTDMTAENKSIHSLWHQLAELKSFNDRVKMLTKWLIQRLPVMSRQEQLFNHFLSVHSSQIFSVSDAANWLCYSPRHLSRKIRANTGMNAEQAVLYKKYLRAVHLIHHTELSLTEITYNCNFYDQSHFIRTFKSFAGITPGEYKQRKSHLMGHLFEMSDISNFKKNL